MEEYPMIPNPICWAQTDPNKHIFLSLFIEVIVLLILIIIISGFVFTYIINICITSKPKVEQLNKAIKEKIVIKKERKIGINNKKIVNVFDKNSNQNFDQI
jgi:hypothetical protein